MESDKFKKQVYEAIDSDDLQLVQALLGPKYCQLWRYWLMHSIFSYNFTVITYTLNYQLPLNIVTAQSQILAKFTEPKEDIKREQSNRILIGKINRELENVEREILRNYKNLNNGARDSSTNVVNMRHMFDPIGNAYYQYDGINSNNTDKKVDEQNKDAAKNSPIMEVREKFKGDCSLEHVSKLDLSRSYNEVYNEMYDAVHTKYKLRLGDELNIVKAKAILETSKEELTNGCNRIRGVIGNISYIIHQITDKKFAKEINDH